MLHVPWSVYLSVCVGYKLLYPNVENGVVWSAMSPFDRVHMILYSTLTETTYLSCIVFVA